MAPTRTTAKPAGAEIQGELAQMGLEQKTVAASKAANEQSPYFQRLNPVTGAPASRGRAMTVHEACAVAQRAAAALPAWAAIGPGTRRSLLLKASERLSEQTDAFVSVMMDELGSTEGWARINVVHGVGLLQEAAALTTQVVGEVLPSNVPDRLSLSVREPAGVVLGIAPWNAPVVLGLRAIATPLACGNTVILKASEICPETHRMLCQLFVDAGFPEGVVNLVSNAAADAGDVVGSLIEHPAVRRINFTGSTKVGRIIATRAAEQLKPVLLELGGKAPLIVLEDASLEEAAQAAALGAFLNQGQICMSTERIIVLDSVADRFVELLKVKTAELEARDPRLKLSLLGAVIGADVGPRLKTLLDGALQAGATLVAGEKCEGVIIQPMIVDRVTSDMRLFREESFGPIVAVCRARDEDQAIELANDSEYGLTASVFTRNAIRGLQVARRIKSGSCHINSPTVQDEPQVPFGGTKSSGYGRFGGRAGIDEFTELRWITLNMASPPN